MSKLKIVIPVLLVLAGGGYAAYTFLLSGGPVPKQKIDGTIYILPKQFTLDLTDGRYATLTVALVLAPGQSAGGVSEGGAAPPDGFGTLPEEAAIRDIITNTVTEQRSSVLTSVVGRQRIKQEILNGIRSSTDVKVQRVLLTDVAVQ